MKLDDLRIDNQALAEEVDEVLSEILSEEDYDTLRDLYGQRRKKGYWDTSGTHGHGGRPSGGRSGFGKPYRRAKMGKARKYLNVPYKDREIAKSHGARWDPEKKKWYAEVPAAGGVVPKGLEPFDEAIGGDDDWERDSRRDRTRFGRRSWGGGDTSYNNPPPKPGEDRPKPDKAKMKAAADARLQQTRDFIASKKPEAMEEFEKLIKLGMDPGVAKMTALSKTM